MTSLHARPRVDVANSTGVVVKGFFLSLNRFLKGSSFLNRFLKGSFYLSTDFFKGSSFLSTDFLKVLPIFNRFLTVHSHQHWCDCLKVSSISYAGLVWALKRFFLSFN
jgi:hypothetical protein